MSSTESHQKYEFIPVVDVGAECAVINSLVYERSARMNILRALNADVFRNPKAKEAYAKVQTAIEAGIDMDSLEVIERIHASPVMADVLANARQMKWREAVKEVRQNAKRRKIQAATCKALEIASDPMQHPDEALRMVRDVIIDAHVTSDVPLSNAEIIEQIALDKKVKSVPWGIRGLDYVVLERGSVHVVAARPRVGKTALALSCAWQQHLTGVSVGLISIEMSPAELMKRLISMVSEIPYERLWVRKDLRDEEQAKKDKAIKEITGSSIYFGGGKSMSMMDVGNLCRHWAQEQDVECIWIDYIQNLSSTGKDTREKVLKLAEGIKHLAQELDLPIVECAMLNRNAENKIPHLEHIMESGAIEQWAHSIILLDRPDVNQPMIDPRNYRDASGGVLDTEGKCVAIVAKNRNGREGLTIFEYDGPVMTFKPNHRYEKSDLFRKDK